MLSKRFHRSKHDKYYLESRINISVLHYVYYCLLIYWVINWKRELYHYICEIYYASFTVIVDTEELLSWTLLRCRSILPCWVKYLRQKGNWKSPSSVDPQKCILNLCFLNANESWNVISQWVHGQSIVGG